MAKILTTKGSAAALEDLIRRAEKELFLISFNFIISDAFVLRLRQAADRGVIISIIYGAYVKVKDEMAFKSIPNLKIYSYKNLHAKIFANETKCIIGSMNFSEASEIDNTELGVLLTKASDADAFKDAADHIKDILEDATLERPMLPKEIADKYKANSKKEASRIPNKLGSDFVNINSSKKSDGYCIRCKDRIVYDTEKPLCYECYSDWAEWENEDYLENYCHTCGKKADNLTILKPECYKCYKSY